MSAADTELTPEGLEGAQRKLAALAVFVTLVLVVLDGAIANVALPSIAVALNAPPSETVWVVTAYQLALVMGILPSAALGESLGHARVYRAGLVLFLTASLFSALAPSLPWLVVGRFLQGAGASPLMGLGLALLRFIFPPAHMGRAIGWISTIIGLTAACAPTVGAGILSLVSWPWLFAVHLPIGLAALLAGFNLPKSGGSGRALDKGSVVLNGTAFAAFVLGAGQMVSRPLLGGGLLLLSVACFAILIRREAPKEAPLIPLDLLRNPSIRISVLTSVCSFSAQMAALVSLPFLYQHEFGMSVLATGLALTPWPLTIAFVGPQAGRLVDAGVPGGVLCAAGGTLLATGIGLIALWPETGSMIPVVCFTILCGAGFGLIQVPNNRNILVAAPKARSGAAGGMQGTARLSGQTLGGLLMSLLFSLPIASVLALRTCLACAAGLALLGGLISLLRIGLDKTREEAGG